MVVTLKRPDLNRTRSALLRLAHIKAGPAVADEPLADPGVRYSLLSFYPKVGTAVIRTRTSAGVGAGGVNAPATRLGYPILLLCAESIPQFLRNPIP